MEKTLPTKTTESGWLMVLIDVKRSEREKEVMSVVIVTKWQGVRRYAASFKRSRRSGNHAKPFNKQRYNELGEPDGSGIIIPDSPYEDMKKWARAIIFDKR